MIIVGLTGGIGSGKTTVGKLFQTLGVPVYNSDQQAKELMQNSKHLIKKIKSLLGEESYVDKRLNRSFIAQKVFRDKELLHKLNAIVHPAVREDFLLWVSNQKHAYVIQETALLFENKAEKLYDKIILVTAPEEIRVERVLVRDKNTREAILARIHNQLSDSVKIPKADFIIENIKLEETKEKVESLNRSLLEYS
ncbi:dephospho-CoA kinase [uncultured Maribacter sp.]|uniref:dephospho-CoA kinase n=1 Tax=uncultured Maribacter sp. TaxID=431308 RepID=UPI00260E39C5|nr:dephospho-CoA kinase [uncultured Maribacter sp.]